MMVFIAVFLLGYLFLSVLLPLRMKIWWKVLVLLLAVLPACKMKLMSLLSTNWFPSPEWPSWLIYGYDWLYGVFVLFMAMVFVSDLLQAVPVGLLMWYCPFARSRYRHVRVICHGMFLLTAVIASSVAIVNGVGEPMVREEPLALRNLPAEGVGLRLALLSDLHADPFFPKGHISRMVEKTMALKPDVILLCGDYVDGSTELRRGYLEPLKDLTAPYGVFAVPGNHDYYSGYEEWRKVLESYGIRYLENEHALVSGISIIGVTDPAAHRFGLAGPDFGKAFENVPDSLPKIVLAHRPALLAKSIEYGADVQFSGHTHGGMIRGFDCLVACFNAGYVAGRYKRGNTELYVSRGTGIWNGFPLRLGVPAEIVLFTVEAAQ